MRKRWILVSALSALAVSASFQLFRSDSAAALALLPVFSRSVSSAYCKPLGAMTNTVETDGSVRAGVAPTRRSIYYYKDDPKVISKGLLCPVPSDSAMPISSVRYLEVDVTRTSKEGSIKAQACRSFYSGTTGTHLACSKADTSVGADWSRIAPPVDVWKEELGMPYVYIQVVNDTDAVRGIYLDTREPEPVGGVL